MLLTVDCDKVRANATAVVDLCAGHGVEVAGVTKCVCGEPDVARAMLAGGCAMLADSRLANVARMRAAGIDAPMMLLRQPVAAEAADAVRLCNLTLVSQVETAAALSAAARAQGVTHDVVLMVETGDRREGVMPEEAGEACRRILDLPAVDLAGLGTVLGCLCGVVPTAENRQRFAELAESLEGELGVHFRIVSAGNTDHLDLVRRGVLPERITQLRVGEGILCGTFDYQVRPDLPMPHQDAFLVSAEVIELREKPSAPEGETTVGAFIEGHEWPDLGVRRRAIVALGEIDLRTSGLTPTRRGTSVAGASSDVLVLDVTDADPPVRLGETLEFHASYTAASTGWASSCSATAVRRTTDRR